MSKIVHLIDRSRVEAREDCPRLRFLNYDYDGDGLEPEGVRLPLLSGIAIHTAHARLLGGQPLETVVTEMLRDYVEEITRRGLFAVDLTKDIVREQSALLEGMLRVWAVVRMPRILEEYDVVSIEERFDWQLAPGLVERLRYDVLLRRKDDGLLFILDYKTVAYPSEVWAEKFEHSLQTCLYLQALRERFPEAQIGGILYEGLVKGQFKKDTLRVSPWFGQKVQHSPYTFAYKLQGEDGLALYQTEYTSKKGYRKVRTFDEMSMKEWVEQHLLPEGRTNELFIMVPAICPPAVELLEVKDQVINEEIGYLSLLETWKRMVAQGDKHAEGFFRSFAAKRTGRCFKYGFDNRCAYVDICFNQGAEPLAAGGGYIRRIPHHDTDLEMVA